MATDKGEKRNLLERFDEITLGWIQSSPDAAKAFLEEEGLSIEEEANHAAGYIKKLQFLAAAKKHKEAGDALLTRAMDKLKLAFAQNAEKAGDVLMSLLISKKVGLQYRKLENWTDQEIREVLNDIDLVSLIEELDKK